MKRIDQSDRRSNDSDAGVSDGGSQLSNQYSFDKRSSSSPRETTDETGSEYYSGAEASTVDNGNYEVIEYDLDDDAMNGDIFSELESLRIEDNSPAAEALRANAQVRVSTVGKAARAVNIQAVRKFVKRATGATKSGYVRGKPPRVPPPQNAAKPPSPLETITEADQSIRPGMVVPVPDNVVPGTAQAGKEGKVSDCLVCIQPFFLATNVICVIQHSVNVEIGTNWNDSTWHGGSARPAEGSSLET